MKVKDLQGNERTVELWIDSDYFQEIYDSLDHDKIMIRSEFDLEAREYLKSLYREIDMIKRDGVNKEDEKNG